VKRDAINITVVGFNLLLVGGDPQQHLVGLHPFGGCEFNKRKGA
jgi:hypothetical protein